MLSLSPSKPDLVVFVNGFPRLSETFVLNELLELERRGYGLHVIALRRPEETVKLEALARLRARVEYLPDLVAVSQRLSVRVAHGALLLRRRSAYLDGMARALASPDATKPALAQAAVLAHRLLRLGAPPVYLHFAHKPATYGRLAALLAGVPYALSAHAKDIWLTPEPELEAKVRHAQVVLTCTTEGHERLADLAGGRTPVRLVYHGVETGFALPQRRPGRTIRVLAIGRLVEKKGYETLIEAAALLAEAAVPFTLRIVGEGPEWPRLQRLVRERGLHAHVHFLGPMTEPEVHAELTAADVFALGCRQLANGDRDGIPNVIVEAMAYGLPVVSTRLAGVAEAVVDGECGLLAAPEDPAGLAEALRRLVADEALRVRFGAAARQRAVERFDRAANVPHVVEALVGAGILRQPSESGSVVAMRSAA